MKVGKVLSAVSLRGWSWGCGASVSRGCWWATGVHQQNRLFGTEVTVPQWCHSVLQCHSVTVSQCTVRYSVTIVWQYHVTEPTVTHRLPQSDRPTDTQCYRDRGFPQMSLYSHDVIMKVVGLDHRIVGICLSHQYAQKWVRKMQNTGKIGCLKN